MKKTRTIGNCFSISSSRESQYATLRITLQEPKTYSTDHQTLACFQWQADKSDWSHWYGMRVSTDLDGYAGDIAARLTRAAKLLTKVIDHNHNEEPDYILAQLTALKIPRVEYDRRLSRNITEDEYQPGFRFMDDWQNYAAERDGCTMAVMAENEGEAQRLMEREWAERIASGGFGARAEKFAEWIKAGRPVKEDSHAKAPTFPTLAALLFKPTEHLVAA